MSNTERKFDAMLTAALERQPQVAIPAGFAARVAASLPARKPVRVTHYGRWVAYLCMMLLVAALAWIAHSTPATTISLHNESFVLEMAFTSVLLLLILLAEMAEGILT